MYYSIAYGELFTGVSSIESSGIRKELSINHQFQIIDFYTVSLATVGEYGIILQGGVSSIESPGHQTGTLNQLPIFNF
ncbi:hypothetical protein [Methanosarcina thermophila]|uniref:hypothetical protein n=1 Tax=Methanosarcina thermophila TaxID=2210 RepID=UPI000AF8B08A|nr:hypothetical protein [Methanosarcina thermophila]